MPTDWRSRGATSFRHIIVLRRIGRRGGVYFSGEVVVKGEVEVEGATELVFFPFDVYEGDETPEEGLFGGVIFAFEDLAEALEAAVEGFCGDGLRRLVEGIVIFKVQLGDLVVKVAFLEFEDIQGIEEGFGVGALFEGVGGVGELAFDFGKFGGFLFQGGFGLGPQISLTGDEEPVHFIQVFFFEDVVCQVGEDGMFEGGAGDASFGAGSAFAVGEGAEVGLVLVA